MDQIAWNLVIKGTTLPLQCLEKFEPLPASLVWAWGEVSSIFLGVLLTSLFQCVEVLLGGRSVGSKISLPGIHPWASQLVLMVNNHLPLQERDMGDESSIPGSGRSPGGGHSNVLQYPCLENPMDRGSWAVQSMGSQSQTPLKGLACIPVCVGKAGRIVKLSKRKTFDSNKYILFIYLIASDSNKYILKFKVFI